MDVSVAEHLKALGRSVLAAVERLSPSAKAEPDPPPGQTKFTASWGECGSQEVAIIVAEASMPDLRALVGALKEAGDAAHDAVIKAVGTRRGFPMYGDPVDAADLKLRCLAVGTGAEREMAAHLNRATSELASAAALAAKLK